MKWFNELAVGTFLFFSIVSTGLSAESSVGGINHFGLTVENLEATEQFFTDVLGFRLLGRDDSYPSAAVANEEIMITLWRTTNADSTVKFDRKNNVGLHHLAFNVASFEALDALHNTLKNASGVIIEFSPEPLSGGPTRHMMIREPSGNRLEFIHTPPN